MIKIAVAALLLTSSPILSGQQPTFDVSGNLNVRVASDEIAILPDGGVIPVGTQTSVIIGNDGGIAQVAMPFASSTLSGGSGDLLSSVAPDGGCTGLGYQLTEQDHSLLVQMRDCTNAHTLVFWGCVSNTWQPYFDWTSDPSSHVCALTVPQNRIAGPTYIQSDLPDGGVGSATAVDVKKGTAP